MSKKSIWIEAAETPNVLIDESKFELFCEIKANNGTFQSLFVKEGGTDIVVEIDRENAIVGMFSAEKDKLRQLFDYIEATISSKDGLSCYESESFPRFLKIAAEAGGRYPIIQNEIYPQKNAFLSGLLQQLRPQRSLSKALREQIQEHTVPCTHVTEEDLQHFAEENSLDAPVITSAENLPEGWNWMHYGDGSGSLCSPDNKHFFGYDLEPYHTAGGIEYKTSDSSQWNVFWGSFSEFKQYAENAVNREYLQNPQPEQEIIEQTVQEVDVVEYDYEP